MNPSLPESELTPLPTAVVPVEAPTTLAPMLTGYSLADPGLSARDRELITERLRARWAEILATALSARSAEPVKPVAEVVSKYGDPEAFGEREIRVLADLFDLPYGTKLYSSPPSLVAGGGVPADEREAFEAWFQKSGWLSWAGDRRSAGFPDSALLAAWQARAALNAAHVLASPSLTLGSPAPAGQTLTPYTPEQQAIIEACDHVHRIREAFDYWKGWSATVATCDRILELLRGAPAAASERKNNG